MAIYDALGGVISSLINANSQKKSNAAYLQGINDTNAANLAIQRETNKQNLDMFNASNVFTERMWNLENSYNSPAAQRARMIQAGVNPSEISAGSASSVQSTAGIPAQAAKMNAPGQTPVPDYGSAFRALGGSVREFKENQLLDEQIKQARLSTSMKEMDRSFYYGEKERRASKEAADILNQTYKNQNDWIRLQDLDSEINHLKVMRSKTERAADDEHDNAIKVNEQIDSQIALNYATIGHMSEQEKIDWFNAHVGAELTAAQVDKLSRESTLLSLEWQFNRDTLEDREKMEQLKKEVQALDGLERMVLIYNLLTGAQAASRMSQSWFRQGFNYVLGVDPQTLLQGLGSAALRMP